jgi:hypothetical protein
MIRLDHQWATLITKCYGSKRQCLPLLSSTSNKYWSTLSILFLDLFFSVLSVIQLFCTILNIFGSSCTKVQMSKVYFRLIISDLTGKEHGSYSPLHQEKAGKLKVSPSFVIYKELKSKSKPAPKNLDKDTYTELQKPRCTYLELYLFLFHFSVCWSICFQTPAICPSDFHCCML